MPEPPLPASGLFVDGTTSSTLEFSCTATGAGNYTYHVHFNDTDGNYQPSDSDQQSLAVNQKVATNVSSVSGSATYGGLVTLTATLQDANNTGVNGKTVTFQLWNGGGYTDLCSVSGEPACPTTGMDGVAMVTGVTLPNLSQYADAGTYYTDVQATFAGDGDYTGNYNHGDLTIDKADQTISFGSLPDKTYGDANFGVSAGATSGLAVSFGASGNCTVASGTVHLTGAGSCTVTASQGGNIDYNQAPNVPQSFNIGKEATSASLGSSANPSTTGQQVTYTATISPHPDGGTVAFKDGSASIGCDSQPVNTTTGQATCAVTYNSSGGHSITATYNGDSNFAASSASNTVSQQVQAPAYTVHLVSARFPTITVQLWNSSNTNVSAASIAVTARCVVAFTATAPTTCPATPVQTINQPFTFQPASRKTAAQYSYTLGRTGLVKKQSYYLLVQAASSPALQAIAFTE